MFLPPPPFYSNCTTQWSLGECSPAQIQAIEDMKPQSSISCHLHFNNDLFDFQASEMFIAEPGFDAVSGKIKLFKMYGLDF